MDFLKKINFFFLGLIFYLTVSLSLIWLAAAWPKCLPLNNQPISKFDQDQLVINTNHESITNKKPLPPPDQAKGIYLTGYTFSTTARRNELIKLVEETELNALVIDFKDPSGRLMFEPQIEKLKAIPLSRLALEREQYEKILDELQEKNIYTIARITTFQDDTAVLTFPDLALKNKQGGVWRDWKGVAWLDMTNPLTWEVPIAKAREAAAIGFDEIQFDYIRFPSDGNTNNIQYYNLTTEQKKYQKLTEFYQFMAESLKDSNVPLSVDLFGLTYHRRDNQEYDLGIGQRLIDAAPYFNYISPMVYPSHYPPNYLGFSNPAAHPYPIVNKALMDGNYILAQATSSKALTRPWLQDFNLGAVYTAAMVRAQIQASEENNTAGWLLWNSSNRYTVEALKKQGE